MSVTCFHTFVFSVECKYALAWEVWLGERVCLDGAGHEVFGVWGVERGWCLRKQYGRLFWQNERSSSDAGSSILYLTADIVSFIT